MVNTVTQPILVRFQEVVGKGVTTVGVNLRTVDNLPRELLEGVRVEKFHPENKNDCVLDLVASNDTMSNT